METAILNFHCRPSSYAGCAVLSGLGGGGRECRVGLRWPRPGCQRCTDRREHRGCWDPVPALGADGDGTSILFPFENKQKTMRLESSLQKFTGTADI